MYERGLGVLQDYAKAMRLCRLASAQGDAYAQYKLGRLYQDGPGVPKDVVTAHMWLNVASANGERDAGLLRNKAGFATRTVSEDRRWPPASPPAARCATPEASRAAGSYTTRRDTP